MHPFTALQSVLPQHALSRLLGVFAASRNRLVKRWIINTFRAAYAVDLSDTKGDCAADFESFNHFFTRPLLPGARPLPADPLAIASPADGTVSQAGTITGGQLLQAKGRRYAVADLLGDREFAATFAGGAFLTVYLAPRDYHRVHAPCDARLRWSLAIPGRLFSVNTLTEQHVPRLFARNERLILCLQTAFGDVALVLVGAMIVASIQVPWPNGPISPYRRRVRCSPDNMRFARGEEVGAFLLGSTVIALFPPNTVRLAAGLAKGATVKTGQAIGAIIMDGQPPLALRRESLATGNQGNTDGGSAPDGGGENG